MIKTTLIALIAIVTLAACGASDAPETNTTDPETASDTRLTDAVSEPLDKAKAVEDMAQQRKAEMDAKLEEIDGGAKTDDAP